MTSPRASSWALCLGPAQSHMVCIAILVGLDEIFFPLFFYSLMSVSTPGGIAYCFNPKIETLAFTHFQKFQCNYFKIGSEILFSLYWQPRLPWSSSNRL